VFRAKVDQLVYDFNCRPVDYVDPGWLAEPERAPIERLNHSADAQARACASKWLLQRFGLIDAYDFEFTLPEKRLLLLDAGTLRDLALFVGLAALTPLLRTWITGARLLQLRRALGQSAFEFHLDHVLPHPAIARYRLVPERAEGLLDAGELPRLTTRLGALLLLLSADAPGSPALRRGLLKLPNGVPQRARALPAKRREAVTGFCINTVIRIRHPQWHWLF
jgi:type III secretion protein K